MSSYRRSLRLSAGLFVLLLGLPAFAQNMEQVQLFAPADITPYGSGPRPHEGCFFSFEGLHWNISKPDIAVVGAPGLTRTVYYGRQDEDAVVESNTLDTSLFRAEYTQGNRIEFGRVCDHWGWIFGSTRLNHQTQYITSGEVDVVFIDPEFGPEGTKLLEGIVSLLPDPHDPTKLTTIRDLPVNFDYVWIKNTVDTWGVELMGIYRKNPMHHGGIIEWYYGARYLQFDEMFRVHATERDQLTSPRQVPNVLANSRWDTEAQNHIVGPQLGVHYFKLFGKCTLSSEARFLAGLNSQNLRQRGTLGTRLDPPGGLFQSRLMNTTSFSHGVHQQEFTPLGELRVDAKYQLTRAIALRVGWTGTWMDGIARASNLVHYEVPTMGIIAENNDKDVFMQGVTFGVDINR